MRTQPSYWVITVNRATGKATTSPLFRDKDEAYEYAIESESPEIYTTVVRRLDAASQ